MTDRSAPTRTWIALLGRRDRPTDGVADYCAFLGQALERHGVELKQVRVQWTQDGWLRALSELRREGAGWRGQWILMQYTALGWSGRGFPFGALAAFAIVRRCGARCAVVFHEPFSQGRQAADSRWIDRIRGRCQEWVIRRLYRRAARAIFTVPLETVPWLPKEHRKATFIPIGGNLPESLDRRLPPDGSREKTVVVFGVTGEPSTGAELADIAGVMLEASRALGKLRLNVIGRGSLEARERLANALAGSGVEVAIRGLLPAEEVAREFSRADALLFVRQTITPQRGSAIAGIARGLPIVGYQNGSISGPLAEAGIEWSPWRDRDALARGMIRVLSDPQRWAELHARNVEAQRKYFSWERIAEQYLRALPGAAQKRPRVLVIDSHPVQYASPSYRLLAQDARVEVEVAYCSMQGAEAQVDPGFGVQVKWDTPLLEGFPWRYVPNRSPRPRVGGFFGLFNPGAWRLIRAGNFDAVVLHTGYVRSTFWIALAAAKSRGIPVLFGTDNFQIEPLDGKRWKLRLKKWLWPRLFGLADMVIVVSSGGAAMMRSLGIPEKRLAFTHNVVDNDWWTERSDRVDPATVRAAWKIPEDARVAVFCGKLQRWKRPGDLLEAFAKVADLNAYLVFAGEGPERPALESAARSLGVSERVRFLGFVNQSGLPEVYTASDVFVLPSEYEPFGMVVNEAMLCGCPAIVSDRVGARLDLVREGETGYVYPCGDIEALASALRRTLSDRARLAQMGEAARSRMKLWSPADYANGFVQAVSAAVGDRTWAKSPGK
jgi:glycosyltransferase involved in cell wall biosynthesis